MGCALLAGRAPVESLARRLSAAAVVAGLTFGIVEKLPVFLQKQLNSR